MSKIIENETSENRKFSLDANEDWDNAISFTPILTKEQAEKANAYMEELFEEEYEEIKEIFYRICISKDFQYKVLVTRRAYLLYEIFASIFLLCPETNPDSLNDFQIYGEVCNSHSLDSINTSENGQEKRYLIFDDIIVHGRTITNTIQKLQEKGIQLEKISVWCLLEKDDINCLSDELKNRVTVYNSCNEEVWKVLSDKLTDIVVRYGKGYTSYIDTYVLSSSKAGKISKFFNDLFIHFCNNPNYKAFNLHSLEKFNINAFTVFYTDNYTENKLHDVGCIRFYEYDDYILCIPYLFIETIKMQDAYPYAFQLLKKYGIDQIPSNFFDHTKSEPIIQLSSLFLKWTVNAIGKKIVEQILDAIGLSIEKTIKRTETFYKVDRSAPIPTPDSNVHIDFYDEANNGDIASCCDILRQSFEESEQIIAINNPVNFSSNDEFLSKLIQGAFIAYSYKIKEEDENRSKRKENRYIGVRTTDIVNSCFSFLSQKYERNIVDKRKLLLQIETEIMSLFIQNWDCGVAAYDFITFKDQYDDVMISAFIKNGEQVFRSLYEYFDTIYQYYYAYSVRTLVTDTQKLRAFGSYLKKALPENMQNQVELFNKYLNINSSYYADVYVVEPKLSDHAFEIADTYLMLNCSNAEN